jgi:UDP-N-acetylglucosamine transferase subunit ALG13
MVDIGQVAQQEASKVAAVPTEITDSAPGRARKPIQADYANCDTIVELAQMARIYTATFSPLSMVNELITFARAWRPDLVIWDHLMIFAGPVVARACGAANARLVYSPDAVVQLRNAFRESYNRPDPIESALRARFDHYHFEFDEQALVGDWTINYMPPWTWRPDRVSYLNVRPLSFNGPSEVPAWLHEMPLRPRIGITLGLTSREIHPAVPPIENLFKAISSLDAEVIATLKHKDIANLASVPDNVRVVEFVPMTALLATCSAVVHHGGAGTVFSALEHGVPQVILPSTFANEKFWGQIAHASALEQQGAGVYVDTSYPVLADELRDHLTRVLDDPSFASNADRLRGELLQIAAPADIVPALITLTEEHRTRA